MSSFTEIGVDASLTLGLQESDQGNNYVKGLDNEIINGVCP